MRTINGGYGRWKGDKKRAHTWKVAPIETYTTEQAREDWQSMKMSEFLTKYHVGSARAYEALGPRKRHIRTDTQKNKEKIDKIGHARILELVNEFGAMPVARLLDMNQNSFEYHALGIGQREKRNN